MSQALCLVGHATHAKLFAACLANVVGVRSILAWPWHRAALTVFVHCAFLLFLASGWLSTLTPRPSYRTPFHLFSFLFWGHDRPHASLVKLTLLSPLLYFPSARLCWERTMAMFIPTA